MGIRCPARNTPCNDADIAAMCLLWCHYIALESLAVEKSSILAYCFLGWFDLACYCCLPHFGSTLWVYSPTRSSHSWLTICSLFALWGFVASGCVDLLYASQYTYCYATTLNTQSIALDHVDVVCNVLYLVDISSYLCWFIRGSGSFSVCFW